MPVIAGEIAVTEVQLSANILVELNGVVFPSPGTYQIDLAVDMQHAATESITLLQIGLPEKQDLK